MHFYLLCVVPKGEVPYREFLARQMAPFDESLEVEPYQEACWCVGREAVLEARDRAEAAVGPSPLFDSEGQKTLDELKKWYDTQFNEWHNKSLQTRDKYFLEHPKKDAPDSTCSECKGTGTYESTRNPNGKWDWYRVGGRYDGVVSGQMADDDEKGFNFGVVHESLGQNLVPLTALLALEDLQERLGYALLGPDGTWLDRNRGYHLSDMPWDEFCNLVRDKLKSIPNPENYLVLGVDCHS